MDNAMEWGGDMIDGLIDGIQSMLGNLGEVASNVASTIADYLHFSVPDKGPLADFDKSGGDMVDEFIQSMERETPELEAALFGTANVINGGMTTDYSGALAGISNQLGALGKDGGPYVFNVYIGQQKFASQVVSAINQENYLGGGF